MFLGWKAARNGSSLARVLALFRGLDSCTVPKGMRRNLGDPDRSSIRKYLLTSRKGKEVEMPVRESDMLIVVTNRVTPVERRGMRCCVEV